MSNYIASLVDPLFRHGRRSSQDFQHSTSQEPASRERQRSNTTDGTGEGDLFSELNQRPRRETWTGDSVRVPQASQTASSPDDPDETPHVNPSTSAANDSGRGVSLPLRLAQQNGSRLSGLEPEGDPAPTPLGELSAPPPADVRASATSADTSCIPHAGGSLGEGPSHNSGDGRNLEDAGPSLADNIQSVDQTLPGDDGMRVLRQKIHNIRDTELSSSEKARLIHGLMTESYHTVHPLHSPKSTISRLSPVPQSQGSPGSPTSHRSQPSYDQSLRNSASGSSSFNVSPYYLYHEDLESTYVPKRSKEAEAVSNDDSALAGLSQGNSLDDHDDDDEDDGFFYLGCDHYKRNVKLQCYTCKRWYTCRFCHDAVEDHALDRRKTEYMLCMYCKSPQPASQWCKTCGALAASYYCSICKLWDNDTAKAIYHCNDCGICRRGQGLGKDFFHCKTCAVCIPVAIETTHRCIESSTKCDCPICGEYMFTSPESVVLMRCGHSLHQKCYSRYTETSYRCPICAKTIMNMEMEFRNLDRTLEAQPMPPEYNDTWAIIYCNDCRAKSFVKYHWLGLKCDICESYNTNQLELQPSRPSEETVQQARVRHSQTLDSQTEHGLPSGQSATSPVGIASESSTSAGASAQPHLSPSSVGRRRNVLASSPRVTNYFGLDPRRDSPDEHGEGNVDSGHSNDNDFFGLRLFSALGNRGDSDDDEEEDSTDPPEDDSDEEEDEDDGDVIHILGHR